MKAVLTGVGVLIGLFVTVAIVTGTSLVGEVVQLHTREAGGEWQTTPLWIVDVAGREYLRAGDPESGWVLRMRANPEVRLERNGQLRDVTLAAESSERALVNRKMADRYGWADDFVGLMGNRSVSTPYLVQAAEASN
jgi:hypothetical protein